MGLTRNSVGRGSVDSGLEVIKGDGEYVVALAGNPNVGKSTVFNALTGMKQHTGNWPGKTVANAQGRASSKRHSYVLVDIPGTYSLMAHSAEEEVARNFVCFGGADAVVVVCDATCLERNMNLVLQVLEISSNVVVCVNLMDEAKRKGIKIDINELSRRLGVTVIGAVARKKKSLDALLCAVDETVERESKERFAVEYPKVIESAVSICVKAIENIEAHALSKRWLALKLLEGDESLEKEINARLGEEFLCNDELQAALFEARSLLEREGVSGDKYKDMIVSALVNSAEEICRGVVFASGGLGSRLDRKIDRIVTSKAAGYPIMLALLALIFWITIEGANYPSTLLSEGLFWIQDRLSELFIALCAPSWLHDVIVLGVYRVLAWVVSVMLPPMAIFFPLFTLLEDAGYLPRVAYNLDKPFKKCRACGKQALTMCMGFGCNACGVTGCRIIDSPRERLLAILTNNFVPCNGRFPTLIALLTMFCAGAAGGFIGSVWSALLLTMVILFGIVMTFLVTKLLSRTLLKGVPSSYTLELPPYRKPQVGRVIVRSVLDRTLFVLGRAVISAIPAGLMIWLAANVTVGDASLLTHCADFLDPFARLLGLDGVILIAFILGMPANEIVMPIIIMAYTAQGSLLELGDLVQMKALFVENGWTWITAISVMLFSLLHWPCMTTLLTIKKETGSWKWTGAAFLLPTIIGMAVCFIFANIARAIAC